ncbi:MAG: hypothetical protein LBV44_10325 [Methylobacillus sp.]|jgi:hypothetical protein|nr:hypothetical protein [Methylobacillus sp.]
MTPQQIVGLAVRLVSVLLALWSLQMLLNGIEAIKRYNIESSYWMVLFVTVFIGIVAAILLWFFPMRVAHKLIPRTRYDNVLQVPANTVVPIACIVLSLWLIVNNIVPMIGQYLSVLLPVVLFDTTQWTGLDIKKFSLQKLVPLALYIVTAFVLATKSHKISAFLLPKTADKKSENTEQEVAEADE